MAFDWTNYAVGGATRPDSFSGLDPAFLASLEQMFSNAPPEIQSQLRVMSGYRSPQRQSELWEGALKKYGSPEAARKWVAPPGRSNHNHGNAVDLRYLDPAATSWAHENAGNFGLSFPLSNENWHIEPVGARNHHRTSVQGQPQAPGTPAPALGKPTDVMDSPVMQPGAAPVMAAAPEQPKQGGLGGIFAAMAPGIAAMAGGGEQAQPQVAKQGDMNATMAAMQGVDQAKALEQSLMPDVASLIGIGNKKKQPQGPMQFA